MKCGLFLAFLVASGPAYSGSEQLQFSTLLGGSAQTGAQAVALDRSGNIVVVGNTAAADFPTTAGAFQRTYAGGQCGAEPQPCRAIFVSKFTPDGSKLLFSTYLDGAGDDTVASVALDAADNIYLTGSTSGNLPNLAPFPGETLHYGTYAAKLSADGSKLLYAALLPVNPYENTVTGLAVDPAGAVYLTGWSTGGIPTVNAFQSDITTAQVFRTGDSGTHWQGFMNGLSAATVYSIAATPSNPQLLYLALSSGLYKSGDGGEHWDALPSLSVTPFSVAVDPSQPQTVYISSLSPPNLMKSTDGGQSWNSVLTGRFVRMVAIDPKNASTLYAAADDGLYKSTDAGNSWSPTGLLAPSNEQFFVHNVVLDPSNPATIYAGTPEGVRKSMDGGLTWTILADGFTRSTDVTTLAIDPQQPQTLFASTTVVSGVYRSNDGGAHWSLGSWPSPLNYVRSLLVDPNLSTTVWAGTSGGLYVSHDGGATWGWPSSTIPEQDVPGLAASGGKLYAVETAFNQPDAFALKLDPTATRIVYATYLGGIGSDEGWGIAVDPAGRAYIAGSTDSFDFPVSGAVQPHSGGRKDAFLAVLDPSGSRLAWSTYFGGTGEDSAAAIALDGAGNIHLAGMTDSPDLPLFDPTQIRNGGSGDAWTATWTHDGSALLFATCFGGSGTDYAAAIASDAGGNVYVAGTTNSPDLPVSGIQTSLQGVLNGFVAAWDGRTNSLTYATYLGGSNVDYALGLAANDRGEVYVAGETLSTDFPLAYPFQSTFAHCSVPGCFYEEGFLAAIASGRRHRPPLILSPPPKRGRLP
jgi:Beta-propeller repeat